jgi:GNAT superfamily N-acetyltransferase
MKDGSSYEIGLCVEPGTQHSSEFLKVQISNAMDSMSSQSRQKRFASPIKRLSEKQLDYLSNLDGKDRLAWCASIRTRNEERGIGLARYVKLVNENNVAEFAVAVVDEFQGQCIGYELLKKLIESAGINGLKILRGFILPSNMHMLSLCRRFNASFHSDDSFYVIADIPVAMESAS